MAGLVLSGDFASPNYDLDEGWALTSTTKRRIHARINNWENAMTIAELIFEQVKKLPDQAAREVLDFVGYIRDRGERTEWRNLMNAQSASLAPVWDNSENQVWDDA